MCESLVYWVWLNELVGLSLKAKRKLLAAYGNPKEIFQANLGCVQSVLAKGSHYATAVAESPREMAFASVWTGRNLKIAEAILNNNEHHNIHVLSAYDDQYLSIFNSDQQAPLVLYYRGTLSDPSVPVVGVIGSRSCTSYGEMVTSSAVADLVEKGNIIASGLSFGIDALAHRTTLEHQGITYAFLPCGLHKAQPASHAELMEQIADTGAVITPYAFGKQALPFRFIGRNGVLSSWCNTLLVIEARMESGSMNTAKSALAKGKRVLAVPNSLLEPKSCGTNYLLSVGAQAYLNDRLFTQDCTNRQPDSESPVHLGEAAVVEALRQKALTTSELANLVDNTNLSVMECIADMKLAEKIVFRSDGKWHLIRGI